MSKDITVKVVPSSGEVTTLTATGNSVREVLEAAGRTSEGMHVLLNGNSATLDTHVKSGDEISLTERPKGS